MTLPNGSPLPTSLSAHHYRDLFNGMNEAFCIMEVLFDTNDNPYDYRLIEVNASFERQTGLSDPEGRTARELVPDLEQSWIDAYGKVARTGEPLRFTQGSEAMGRWFDVSAFRLGVQGSHHVALIFSDISQQKKHEDALLKSELQYRTLFDSIDEGFCIIEVLFDDLGGPIDYRFLEVNPAFERQTGLVDVIGKRIRELAPTHEKYWFDIYGHIALTGEPARFENHAAALGYWYDVYAFRYGAPEDRQVGVLFNDINERKWAEEALRVSEERERNIASHLQTALIPALPSDLPGLTLAAHYQPALQESEVGGDFFDVFPLNEGCTAMVLADLSGKGLAAAQQVATLRNMLRYALYNAPGPASAINELNRTLTQHQLLSGFATLFVGCYNREERRLTYVNCGQEPGLVWHNDKARMETLDPTGPVLGGFASDDYSQMCVELAPGDVLALFTDGLTEAGPTRRQMLQVEGVAELFRQNVESCHPSMTALVRELIAGVERKARGGIRDDMTLLVGSVM